LDVSELPTSIPPGTRRLDDSERRSLLDEMTEVVVSSHLFKSLDDAGRERLLTSGYVCSFDPDSMIIEQGTEGDLMFLVLDGKVRIDAMVSGGTLQLAELGRGACIGEVSVVGGGPRTATVRAASAVSCVAFPRHRIQEILDDYPKVRKVLQALVEGRARDTIEKIVKS
jgi:CRP-like cAMP-binding protein